MCYKFPGPRCSNHAKKALNKALLTCKFMPTHGNYEALMAAKTAYDTTPRGQRELQAFIDREDVTEDARFMAQLRLQRGVSTRKYQIKQYNFMYRKEPYNPEADESMAEMEKNAIASQHGADNVSPAKDETKPPSETSDAPFVTLPYENIIVNVHDDEALDNDDKQLFDYLDRYSGAKKILIATHTAEVMRGEHPAFTDAHRMYYDSPQLLENQVDLKGWVAPNPTHERLMKDTIRAIEDSHVAALDNAQITEDPVKGYFRKKAGRERELEAEDKSHMRVYEYDQGWIHSYAEFANELKDMDIPDVKTEEEYDILEKKIVLDRIETLKKRTVENPSDFTEGAIHAWEDYRDSHLSAYKSKS